MIGDWWDYIAHAQKSQERSDHKYIARVEVGTRRGKILYRYFYTIDQYKRYLSGKEKGTKSELEKRQSPLHNLKRLGQQFGNLLKDYDKANNESNLKNRRDAHKRLTYDKALLKNAGKEFIDSVLDKLKVPVKEDAEANDIKTEQKHLYVKRITLPNGKYRYFYTESSYRKYLERVRYQASEPDFMKDVPEIDRYADETNAQAMADVNEDYNEYDPRRSQNCIFCTNAYELRQRGYNVQAAEHYDDFYDNEKHQQFDFSMSRWYENPDYEVITEGGGTKNVNELMDTYSKYWTDSRKFSKNLNTETMEQYKEYNGAHGYTADDLRNAILSKSPKNSRGQFTVRWAGGQGGHSIIYEVDKHGNVIFRDAQVNQIYTADFLAQNIEEALFVRTDNLTLKPDILYTVEDN